MHLTASNIERIFFGMLTLYVLLECALTILHTHAAERAGRAVPSGFENKLSPAAIEKATAYTAEIAQANLLLAIVGAAYALVMTFGQGLTVITAAADILTSNPLVAQWLVLAAVTFTAALIEFPFGWFAHFRVQERFGYMLEDRRLWMLREIRRTFAGWLVSLPVLALLIVLLEHAGGAWWWIGWVFFLLYLFWRWKFSNTVALFWKRRSQPMADRKTAEMILAYMRHEGFVVDDVEVMTKPLSWAHSHLVIPGWGKKRRVVVFAHAAQRLEPDELLALIAHDVGHVKHLHLFLRAAVYAVTGWLVFRFGGWGAEHVEFFEGFGYAPAVSFLQDGTRAGYVLAIAVTAFPILYYPLRPAVNLFARLMQYDADEYAAKAVSTDALVRALVKLHRDYKQTLTPSRLYSLFHYSRPHAGMRVAHLLWRAKKTGRPLDRPSCWAPFDASPWTGGVSVSAAKASDDFVGSSARLVTRAKPLEPVEPVEPAEPTEPVEAPVEPVEPVEQVEEIKDTAPELSEASVTAPVAEPAAEPSPEPVGTPLEEPQAEAPAETVQEALSEAETGAETEPEAPNTEPATPEPTEAAESAVPETETETETESTGEKAPTERIPHGETQEKA